MSPTYLPRGLTESGLVLLLDAFDAASNLGCDKWQLAVEIGPLERAGADATGLRWLILKNYAEHALELTLGHDEQRSFRILRMLRFGKRSCFMLTQAGADFGLPLCESGGQMEPPVLVPQPAANYTHGLKPRWNAELRQLWDGDTLVKEFHGKKIIDQERLLAAEEEDHWAPGIDNPFSAQGGKSSLERAQVAAEGLNRRQKVRRFHFSVDPSTERVHWGPAKRRSPHHKTHLQ
jgi:hypothetical protein